MAGTNFSYFDFGVSEKYKEPVEGRFEDATADILRRINADHGEDEIVPEDEDEL